MLECLNEWTQDHMSTGPGDMNKWNDSRCTQCLMIDYKTEKAGLRGRGEGWIRKAQEIFRVVKLLCMIL